MEESLGELERIRRRLGIALVALLGVIAIGVTGFMIIGEGRYGVVDALYMTVITLTTVGFAEIVDMSGNPTGRLFTVFLLIGGMGIAAYTITMLAAFLIGIQGHLHDILARSRMEKTIEKMEGHHVVCGDSTACEFVAEELILTGRDNVLVVPAEAMLSEVRDRLGEAMALAGDPTDDDVLLRAGVDRAAGVVFCMENEKDNLLGVFIARRLAPRARIVAAASTADMRAKLEAAGADAVVNPSRIGGLRMASELVRPTVVSFLDQMLRVQGGSLRVEEIAVPPGVDASSGSLGSLRIEEVPGALLVAVRQPGAAGFAFKPASETPLAEGMTLIVMGDA